jgi:hypothetical protein
MESMSELIANVTQDATHETDCAEHSARRFLLGHYRALRVSACFFHIIHHGSQPRPEGKYNADGLSLTPLL